VTEVLVVPARFCGPAASGNGGWTSGALAARVGAPTVRVSLRRPPPLDVPMPVSVDDGGATVASYDGQAVAVAEATGHDLRPVDVVPAEVARAASASYPGLVAHPFPTCFACGTGREEGDGLRIFPGPVAAAPTRVAAPWTPHPSVADGDQATYAVTWAALDCAGGWAGDLTERMMVLASMTARVDALPVVGEEHVVVGEDRGHDGRKTWTATTLYDAEGRALATAEHLWVAVDPALFR
jgi:hypothetical protein